MIIREATRQDIPQLHSIRMSVKENALSNPLLVQEKDYVEFLEAKGKGWLCEFNNEITGFAIVDTVNNNVWALFVKSGFEHKGIGRMLHDQMLNWFYQNKDNDLWLSTAANTRAESFYSKAGWEKTGLTTNGEVRFNMTREKWVS